MKYPFQEFNKSQAKPGLSTKHLRLTNKEERNMEFGFQGSSVVKNPPDNAGDTGLIPGSGRSPGEGNSNPLQYSCLENPLDRRAWQALQSIVSQRVEQN